MKCPSCKAEMKVILNSKKGTKFWGCTNFPECRETVPYREAYLGDKKIGIGATVKIEFIDDGDVKEVYIVEQRINNDLDRTGSQYIQGRKRISPTFGVDPQEGLGESSISDKSKLGKALIGRLEGETVEYKSNDGIYTQVNILSVY